MTTVGDLCNFLELAAPLSLAEDWDNVGLLLGDRHPELQRVLTCLTLTTEVNYVREDGFKAEAFGIAQYASYTLSDTLTLNGRVEVFRDANNFFVSNPKGSLDYANSQRGTFSQFITASRPTTYGEITAGVTFKPAGMPAQLSTLLFRPELRYDRALNNSRAFNDGKDHGAFTLATDVVIGF